MKERIFCGLFAAALVVCALPAKADTLNVTITVAPWLAPNAFGSPSYPQAQANAIEGMYQGLSDVGSGPSEFKVTPNVTSAQTIVTGFPSWLGSINPGTAYGPAYASELGNRMTFAVGIVALGGQIAISDLSFSATSTDPGNGLTFAFGAGSYGYGSSYIGVDRGADGILGTADDVIINSGPATQLVDAIFGRGSGNSYAAYCTGTCDAADQQANLDAAIAWPGTPYQFTGQYSIDGFSGDATFNIAPSTTPLPAALPLFGSALVALGFLARRRQKKS